MTELHSLEILIVLSVCWLTWCIHKATSVILKVLAEMVDSREENSGENSN